MSLAAKRPATPVAGPYGHPFHPLFVTLPIGAWVSSLVLDIASKSVDGPGALARGAYWLIGIGIVGAVVAAVFGLLDLLTIPRRTRAFAIGLTHMSLNLTVVVLYVVNFVLRTGDDFVTSTKGAHLALSVVALVLLTASGWLGGMLAYSFGVRVADEASQAKAYQT
jgi:uncharacterized membrane protein